MSKYSVPILVVALGLFVVSGTTTAQISQGDLVLTSYVTGPKAGMFYTTWSGSLRTLRTGFTFNAVKMAYGNAYALAIGTNTGNLYKFTGSGSFTTLTTLTTPGCAALALDQDGAYLVANPSTARLLRVTSTSVTTWLTLSATVHGRPNAICRDGNTGDWIVGTVKSSVSGYLLRVNRVTKSISTMTSLGPVYGVDWIPQTGEYAVARGSGTSQYFSLVRSTGSVRLTGSVPYANCITVSQKTGRIFVGTANGRVYAYSYTGSPMGYRYYGSYSFSGIDCYQDENVTSTTYTSRKTVRLYLKFPESPSRPYYVALSFSPRSGIRLGAYQWLNVQPDALFFLTFPGKLPYFTSGFVGTLNSNGYGSAYFVMPYTGLRVYATAVAINPSMPNGLDVGNVAVIDAW